MLLRYYCAFQARLSEIWRCICDSFARVNARRYFFNEKTLDNGKNHGSVKSQYFNFGCWNVFTKRSMWCNLGGLQKFLPQKTTSCCEQAKSWPWSPGGGKPGGFQQLPSLDLMLFWQPFLPLPPPPSPISFCLLPRLKHKCHLSTSHVAEMKGPSSNDKQTITPGKSSNKSKNQFTLLLWKNNPSLPQYHQHPGIKWGCGASILNSCSLFQCVDDMNRVPSPPPTVGREPFRGREKMEIQGVQQWPYV